MGQRTQFLVIEKKPNGVVEKRLYHNQFGTGKRMYNGVMSILESILDGVSCDGKFEPLLEDVELKNIPSFKHYFFNGCYMDDETKCALEGADANNIATITNLFNLLDNNDGGVVMELEWGKKKKYKFYEVIGIKLGFLLCTDRTKEKNSSELEDEYFKLYVSPERFRQVEGKDYFNNDYFKSFMSLCKFCGVKWLHEVKAK